MKAQLEDCARPDDQDVVKGVVAFLFEKLPADFRDKKHEDVLRANGLCRVRVLRRLTEEKLESLGVSMGDSMMLVEALQAEEPAPVAFVAAPAEAATRPLRRPEMRPFPKCGATRCPDLEG